APEARYGLVHEGAKIVRTAHVAANGERASAGALDLGRRRVDGAGQPGRIGRDRASRADDRGTAGCEPDGERLADPARRAGDDGNAALELFRHGSTADPLRR